MFSFIPKTLEITEYDIFLERNHILMAILPKKAIQSDVKVASINVLSCPSASVKAASGRYNTGMP